MRGKPVMLHRAERFIAARVTMAGPYRPSPSGVGQAAEQNFSALMDADFSEAS